MEGLCPVCGKSARGDQCDECGAVLRGETQPVCAVCGSAVSFRSSRHLLIAITRLKDRLQELVDTHENWRKNAAAFSRRYLGEGLLTRALKRGIWGGHRCTAEGGLPEKENISGRKMCWADIYKPRGAERLMRVKTLGAGRRLRKRSRGGDGSPGNRHRGRKRGDQALLCAWEG